MIDHVMLADASGFGVAAALTFGIPIGTLALAVAFGFFQRKPLPDARRAPLFPLGAIPQRSYDLAIMEALHERDRQAVVEHSESRAAAAERPVGD